MIKTLTFIGLGSFFGGIARYGLSKLLTGVAASSASLWGTFAANILGCFLIGLFYGLFDRYHYVGEHWRLFLTVGFCGGFTTFSTFINENYRCLTHGRIAEMILYATISFGLGLLTLHIGHMLATSHHAS